jgi:hypothetical protein
LFTAVLLALGRRPTGPPDLAKTVFAMAFLVSLGVGLPLVMEIHPRTLVFSAQQFAIDYCGRSKTYEKRYVESVAVDGCGEKAHAVVSVRVMDGVEEVTFEVTTRVDPSYVIRRVELFGYHVDQPPVC